MAVIFKRNFHFSKIFHKNPYTFYDLSCKQPHLSQSLETGPKSSVFNTIPASQSMSANERAKLVFGTPLDRRGTQLERAKSTGMNRKPHIIGGVKVNPRPLEPDNCCMSGCINCVWELYREELDEWNRERIEAVAGLKKQGGKPSDWPKDFWPPTKILNRELLHKDNSNSSKEEDEDVKSVEEKNEKELWSTVDMGIRVFVETEKALKRKHMMEKEKKINSVNTESFKIPAN